MQQKFGNALYHRYLWLCILQIPMVLTHTGAEAKRNEVPILLPDIGKLWRELVRSPVTDLQHELLPRESASDDVGSCSPDSNELARRLSVIRCDAEYIRAVQEAQGRDCDLFVWFLQYELEDCGTDRNGTFCYLHRLNLRWQQQPDMRDIARDIQRECFEELSLDNCRNKCRRVLEEFAARFDCCIHSTSISTSDNYAKVLAPQLWSSCGVERPEPCKDAPNYPDPREGVTCSYLCAATKYLALDCKYRASQEIQVYRECSDEASAVMNEQVCSFNDKGEFCFLINIQRDHLLNIYSKCYRFFTNNVTCLRECQEALMEFKDLYGCCINSSNAFFDSDIGVAITRGDLWRACEVESPGFCRFPSDPSLYDKLIDCDVCSVSVEGTSVSESFFFVDSRDKCLYYLC